MFRFDYPPQTNNAVTIKFHLSQQTQRLADGLELLAATSDDNGALVGYAAVD